MKLQNILKKVILTIIFICIAFVYTDAQRFDIYKGDTINYINNHNQKEGPWIIFKDGTDKIFQEGSYLNGKKEGLWTAYYSNEHKKSEISYIQGEKRGYAKTYFENGNTAEEGTWLADKWVGKYKSYYKNGKLTYSWNYNDKGTRSGYQEYFYKNGKIKITGEWEDGKEKGIIREYYSSGALKAEKTFDEGKVDINTVKIYRLNENKNIVPDTNINETNINDTNIIHYINSDIAEVFCGNGYYVFYNKDKKIEKEGVYSDGILINGKHYIYDEKRDHIKTAIYKEGKIIEVVGVEKSE